MIPNHSTHLLNGPFHPHISPWTQLSHQRFVFLGGKSRFSEILGIASGQYLVYIYHTKIRLHFVILRVIIRIVAIVAIIRPFKKSSGRIPLENTLHNFECDFPFLDISRRVKFFLARGTKITKLFVSRVDIDGRASAIEDVVSMVTINQVWEGRGKLSFGLLG